VQNQFRPNTTESEIYLNFDTHNAFSVMKHLPNFITSLNLLSGFIAIICILDGNLVTASWFILAAMIFDFMDGFVARALKAYSEIGKELDSLADLVSFGVAPGLILFRLMNSNVSHNGGTIFSFTDPFTFIFMIIAAIMPVCGALRLARFNLDTTQSTSFKGLPIPANALAVISIIIAGRYSGSALLDSILASPVFLAILTLFLSGMMITRVPLLSLKFKDLKLKGNEGRYLVIIISLVIVSVLGFIAIPLIIPVYIIVSIIYFLSLS
jgi:CDP-diacylglycerol---serine O-phosphatidyltransferase